MYFFEPSISPLDMGLQKANSHFAALWISSLPFDFFQTELMLSSNRPESDSHGM
jgi:hypothetical protein